MGYSTGTIDTNVLLRIILGDSVEHEDRAKALISRKGTYLTVLDQAIIEVAYVLEGAIYQMPRSVIVNSLKLVLAEPRLEYDEALFTKVFNLYSAHPKLSFTDCYMACKTEALERAPLYTFDTKLVKQAQVAKPVPLTS